MHRARLRSENGAVTHYGRPVLPGMVSLGRRSVIAVSSLLLLYVALDIAAQETRGGVAFARGKAALSAGGTTFSSGGIYNLAGTVGRPDDAAEPLAGGDFSVRAGMWPAGAGASWIFGDSFESADLDAWSSSTGTSP